MLDCIVVRKQMIRWLCPECQMEVTIQNELALQHVERIGKCQGCLAAETIRKASRMAIAAMLEFWARCDCWPESNSWIKAAIEMGYWKVAG